MAEKAARRASEHEKLEMVGLEKAARKTTWNRLRWMDGWILEEKQALVIAQVG